MPQAATEHRLDHLVSRTLLGGLILSCLLLVAGLTLAFRSGEPRPPGAPPPFRNLISFALSGDGVALLELGLLALMITPVVRVGVLAIGWWAARDRRFSLVAIGVLGLLVASILLGLH
jgi:uncharacterized membrane protein